MLKQLTVPMLGLAVLAATAFPAAADRGRTRLIEPLRNTPTTPSPRSEP